MNIDPLLSQEECSHFLTTHLKFHDWKTVLRDDKIKFVEIFVKQHLTEIAYQNVTSACIEGSTRDCPTMAQVIQTGLSGVGGICFELNYFVKILLKTLGFDVIVISGTINCVPVPNNHCLTVVRFSPNKMYLIDVGLAQPTCEPIPLHKLPFRGQMLEFPYEYRWVEDENVFVRIHITGKVTTGPFKDKTEDNFMSFTLEPRDFDYFYSSMATIYKDFDRFNLRGLLLSKYYNFEIQDEEAKDCDCTVSFVIFFGKHIYTGNKDIRIVQDFSSYDDMIPEVKKFFPKLCEKDLEAAFLNFRI